MTFFMVSTWEADMPFRMAGYTWRLYERYDQGVYPVVMVLRPGSRLEDEWTMQVWERQIAHCRFEVIPLWQVDAQTVIEQQLEGLYPLLPLMHWPQAEPASILEQSQRLILARIEGREARADAYVALRVLSGIHHPLELVQQIMQRRELMLESPVSIKNWPQRRESALGADV